MLPYATVPRVKLTQQEPSGTTGALPFRPWTDQDPTLKLFTRSEAIGYPYVHVQCRRCGHQGQVPAERWNRARHKYCRKCGSRNFDVRQIWKEGKPPDNVIPFDAGRRLRRSQG